MPARRLVRRLLGGLAGKRLAPAGRAPQTARVPEPLTPVEIPAGPLLLRPWAPADADAVFTACQDAEVQRWTSVPSPYRREDAVEYVERISPAGWAAGTGAHFAVVPAVDGDGPLLGSISLMDISEGSAEVGFWASGQARGRGVMTAATRALCRWGFAELGLARITWFAYVGNDASRRVAEKVGFQHEGTLRAYLSQRGRRHDAWVAGLLPGDPEPDAPAHPPS